jgi:flagellar biosynthesis GTPase FlhF
MQSKTILATACLLAFQCLAHAQEKSRSSETDILTIYKGSHTYKEVSVAGKTTEVDVDDQKVPVNEMQHYDSLIQVMRKDVNEWNADYRARDDEWEQRDQERAQRNQEQAQRRQEQAERQQERDQEQAERQQEQAERRQEQAERQQERDQEQAERRQEQMERDQERAQGELDREQGERDRAQGELDRAQGERDREKAREDMAAMRQILQYLVDKKVVAHAEDVNGLVLNDSALYVNGNKQPNDIYQALKDKYADWAHYGFSYGNCQAPNTHIHMDLFGGCCR